MQSQQKRPNYDRFEAFLPGIGIGIPAIGLRLFFTINYPEKGKLVNLTFSSFSKLYCNPSSVKHS